MTGPKLGDDGWARIAIRHQPGHSSVEKEDDVWIGGCWANGTWEPGIYSGLSELDLARSGLSDRQLLGKLAVLK